MKNTAGATPKSHEPNDMRVEYSFDYSRARPNRFAGRVEKKRLVVVLDPDVSEVFATSESVNAVLRALISTMPTTKPRSIRESEPRSDEEEQS